MVKMERRRRARVVLPEEEGPERAMRWVLKFPEDGGGLVCDMVDGREER